MPIMTIDGKSCFYQDRGTGFPLLFGHSYLWSSEMWEPQLEALSQEFRCIAPDLWGHGQSEVFSDLSMELLADHAWKLMQTLGIDQFGVVGLSVGGMWGTHLALNHPEAVKALVLMDTYVGSEPQATQLRYFALIDQFEKAGKFTPALLDQIVPLFFSKATFQENPELPVRFRESLSSFPAEKIPCIASLGRAIFSREDLLGRFSSLALPTLVVVGKDDIPRPPKEAQEMASCLSNSMLIEVEEAGHISNLEQAEMINQLLSEFLTLNVYGIKQ